MTIDEAKKMLRALLPPGGATIGETFTKLVEGFAPEIVRAGQSFEDLHLDFLPDRTVDLIPEWERVTGLSGAGMSTEARRNDILARVTATGGASKAYMIEVAQKLGYLIDITEYKIPYVGRLRAGDAIVGSAWAFTFSVTSSELPISYAEVGDPVDTPLASWSNLQLLNLFAKLKPAHTFALFAYQQTFFVAGDRAGRRLNEINV